MPTKTKVAIGRREQNKAVNRQEILLSARNLFAEAGLYSTTVEDITARAGVAKGTFYLYFDDRDAVVTAVVVDVFEALRRAVEARLARGVSLLERARVVALAHLEHFVLEPEDLRILHQVRGVLKYQRTRWKKLAGALSLHLERIGAWLGVEGRARRSDLAVLLFGCVSGSASVLVTQDSSADLAAHAPAWARSIAGAVSMAARANDRKGKHR